MPIKSIVERFRKRNHRKEIDGLGKLTFAKSGEDVLINEIMRGQVRTYVDIGSYMPIKYSNSYLFYLQGASGVCVEPNTDFNNDYKKHRLRDKLLNVLISNSNMGEYYNSFQEDESLNTMDVKQVEYVRSQWGYLPKRRKIESLLLNDVIENYFIPHYGRNLDLLLLDAEGSEERILSVFSWRLLPSLIVLEVRLNCIDDLRSNSLIKLVVDKKYDIVSIGYVDDSIYNVFLRRANYR